MIEYNMGLNEDNTNYENYLYYITNGHANNYIKNRQNFRNSFIKLINKQLHKMSDTFNINNFITCLCDSYTLNKHININNEINIFRI